MQLQENVKRGVAPRPCPDCGRELRPQIMARGALVIWRHEETGPCWHIEQDRNDDGHITRRIFSHDEIEKARDEHFAKHPAP
jgi:hypothetical protein